MSGRCGAQAGRSRIRSSSSSWCARVSCRNVQEVVHALRPRGLRKSPRTGERCLPVYTSRTLVEYARIMRTLARSSRRPPRRLRDDRRIAIPTLARANRERRSLIRDLTSAEGEPSPPKLTRQSQVGSHFFRVFPRVSAESNISDRPRG